MTNPVVDSLWKDGAAAEVALDIPDVYGTIIVAEPAYGHFFHWYILGSLVFEMDEAFPPRASEVIRM